MFGLLACAGPASAAEASAWVEGAHSRARLIDAGLASEAGTSGGGSPGATPSDATVLLAGIEIRLAPQFITYWRDPGDAGVPPTFDFHGSLNLAAVEVRYPAPEMLDEAGAKAFGYRDDVVFPVMATPADPSKPVRLSVRVDYAACHDICLPVRAELTGMLDARTSADAGRVRSALDAVPRPDRVGGTGGPVRILAVRPDPEGFSVEAEVGGGRGTLFVEAPQGWVYEAGAGAKPEGAGLTVFPVKRLDRPQGTGLHDLTVVLTLVAPAGAIEVPVQLDGGVPKR